jgi:hypothetical protein
LLSLPFYGLPLAQASLLPKLQRKGKTIHTVTFFSFPIVSGFSNGIVIRMLSLKLLCTLVCCRLPTLRNQILVRWWILPTGHRRASHCLHDMFACYLYLAWPNSMFNLCILTFSTSCVQCSPYSKYNACF